MPVRAFLTAGPVADCQVAPSLIEGLSADALLADRGYDSDTLIEQAESQGIEVVIPPRRNRKKQRAFDKTRYRNRHIVGNVFAQLKQWRGLATRYAKRASSFLATIHIRFIAVWADIL